MTATLTASRLTFTTLTGKVVNPGPVNATSISIKQTGEVVDRKSAAVLGTCTRTPHPTRVGTTIFTATYLDGTLVYQDVYRREAIAALVKRHNEVIVTADVVAVVKHGPIALRPGELCGKQVRNAIQHPQLTTEESYALSSYTGSSYKAISNHVLNGDASDALPHVRAHAKNLTAAIERSVVTKPFAVLRYFPAHTALRVFGEVGSRVGDEFEERRFTSTTTATQNVGNFGSVQVRYHVTPGARALEVNRHVGGNHHSEYEVIMPPGQRYRILADELVNGTREMEMETITDEPS